MHQKRKTTKNKVKKQSINNCLIKTATIKNIKLNMKSRLFILLFFCCTSLISFAQDNTIKVHLNKLAKNQSSVITKEDMVKLYKDGGVVSSIEPFLQSGTDKVRREAVRLCAKIGANHDAVSSRRLASNQLLDLALSPYAELDYQVAKGLRKFKYSDFDTKAKGKVETLVKREQSHQDKWIELAGFLQLEAVLKEIAPLYREDKKMNQKISLALTRCGDDQKIDNLMSNVRKIKVNDDFIYGVVPSLVYTRQKESMDYLFDIILSTDKNCTPAGPDIKGNIACGYRVMEAVAPYVKGIPLELGASGDLVTTDYAKAIEKVREWITRNKATYELTTDIY